MKILILGATGFIGSEITRRLLADGHAVTGLSRNTAAAKRKLPSADWITADLARMTEAKDWQELAERHDAIVNCAGALQDGLSDDLSATQEKAMLALYQANVQAGRKLIVQISARTSGAASDKPFLATKQRADAALAASGLPSVILRPALVMGRNAHGGTALLRALASMPCAVLLVHADSPVQTVALEDLAALVSDAISGRIAPGSDLHLAAGSMLTLRELVLLHRQWLGLTDAKTISLPAWLAKPVSWLADLAGELGWRSPLRSTAMAVMSEGVTTNAVHANGFAFKTAAQTLSNNPSGVQDLWFARLFLLKPVIIVCLSIFWLLSGIIPLFDIARSASHFLPFMPEGTATVLTVATCIADIALGTAVLLRPYAREAMVGMLLVTFAYLAGGTLLEPALWLDPLGPLVKVLPSIALTLAAMAIFDER
ncbi:SDR family oxidoreductase [Agrobacterium sp. rho-13.3]|uniref:SDR family oxidoreductase n=1 Tax=Agrobacterium sp. rho-13.3 TaxID=3072980 RepID=UPI002A11905B|nr:SDR family oxidoreductase [Agrobacterium sp. rho-13.3]MDX8309934.1 SDR family oxidoreductase [Agrobacterium sp. rho-13.3]